MEPHLRQQFDLLLQEATGNFVERVVHRCGGPETALARLQTDPESEGVWVGEFVDSWFSEQLLDSTAGACFVLDALERRTVPACRAPASATSASSSSTGATPSRSPPAANSSRARPRRSSASSIAPR